MTLTDQEQKARTLLIHVAQGSLDAQRRGFISYKELWTQVTHLPWARNRSRDVVDWIKHISIFDLAAGRPPLNEIVVSKGKREPNEPWERIKKGFQQKHRVEIPYRSHHEAQEACWRYWGRHDFDGSSSSVDEEAVEEGYKQDRTVTFRKRNAAIIKRRKQLDGYACRACGFHLSINGTYIIDCHHTNPLGLLDAVQVTRLEDLVCLCPTCHRIAHTKRYPLSVEEIKAALK